MTSYPPFTILRGSFVLLHNVLSYKVDLRGGGDLLKKYWYWGGFAWRLHFTTSAYIILSINMGILSFPDYNINLINKLCVRSLLKGVVYTAHLRRKKCSHGKNQGLIFIRFCEIWSFTWRVEKRYVQRFIKGYKGQNWEYWNVKICVNSASY